MGIEGRELLISDKKGRYAVDLGERLLEFSVNILKFLMALPRQKELDVIKYQLSKSATAIGANYSEAQAGSFREFVQKVRIALREANESIYWLKIVEKLKLGQAEDRDVLLSECKEIASILGAIVSRSSKKLDEEP